MNQVSTAQPRAASGTTGLVILHALAPAPYGGLEHVVGTLARAQARAGHRVHIAAVVDAGQTTEHLFLTAARGPGITVHAHEVGGRGYLREYRLMRMLCRAVQPDVVHTHGYRTDVIDARAARAQGVPTVATVHGFTRDGWKNRVYEWLQRRSYGSFDAVVAVSRAQVGELVEGGARRERVHCVPNGWSGTGAALSRSEARRALGLDDGAFVAGWVGRLSAEKGPDVMLAACAQLDASDGVTVSMIGDGPQRAALEDQAARTGLTSQLRWHGALAGAGRLFAAFDVFVLSSRTEGTPIALFEAMAAGVPVVAMRVGGVPDVVSADEAQLVDAGDHLALAQAIANVRLDPAAARARAASARRRLAEAYDVTSWIARYEAVYRAIQRADRRRSA